MHETISSETDLAWPGIYQEVWGCPRCPGWGSRGQAPPQKSNAPQMTPQPRSAFGIKLASLCSLVSLLSSFNSSTGFTSFSFRYTSSLVLHQCSKTFRLCSVIAVTVVVTHVIKIEIKMNLTRASGSSSDIVICFYFTVWMNKNLNLVHP